MGNFNSKTIDKMNMQQDMLQIINHYGLEKQERKLVEEVFEFLQAVEKWHFNKENNCSKDEKYDIASIEEEMADVLVLLNQFAMYFGIQQSQIDSTAQYKIMRTLCRISNEQEDGNKES